MTTTTLPDMPQGCGCAACQAAARADLSSDYTGTATPTLSEANSLYSGYRWGSGTSGITLAYKFFTALPSYYSASDDEANHFQAFNTQMINAVGRVLEQIESFTNITFVETTGNATHLGFAQASLPSGVGAWAYYPSTNALGGDVWTNNIYSSTQTPAEGNYGFYTLMHEIGHALGLQHSFTAGLTGDEASSRYSVMAYDWSPFFASSYMVYDIAALQKIYGANMSYHTGDDTYVTNASLAYTIWDAGGNDTLDASAQHSTVTLDLREGEYSSVGLERNIGIAYGAVVENAIGGSGNDVLIGNAANNALTGNAGNDIFVASAGTDSVDGGTGTDLLVFDSVISDFVMSLIDSVTLALQDLTGVYGTTTASNVENFEFNGVAYDFATLSSVASASGIAETLDQVNMSVFSSFKWKGKVRKFWTDIDSSLETVQSYQGDDFRYNVSHNVLTVGRSNDSGHDTLVLTAVTGYEGYVKSVVLNDVQNIEVLTFNHLNSIRVSDVTATQDLQLTVSGGYEALLSSGTGDDTIDITSDAIGRQGASYKIYSGDGDDTISVSGTSSKMGVYVDAGNGDDTVTVTTNAGAKVYGGAGNDTIDGGSGGDILYGYDDNDTIHGNDGNDSISGDSGDDILYGDTGNDSINGGDGNDILYGGYGSDTLVGGAGADIFVFENISRNERDNVRDFNASEDTIDISAVLAGYDPLTDAINDFVQITYNKKTKGTYLQIDADGTDSNDGFVAIAQINGLRGHDVQDLIDNGHLVIA